MRPRKATARATVLAITSGKGGVGKTNVTINVAIAMARLGLRVGVLDADFGLGNVDVLLGIAPVAHVGHVVAGEKHLQDVVVRGPHGITIIPASSGLQSMTSLSGIQRDRLLAALDLACRELDFLLIDTAAGISDNVMDMLKLAERIVLVTSLEPSAIVDAYALTKVLTAADAAKDIGVVVNGARTAEEAGMAYRQLETATRRFLKRSVAYYGHITDDPAVRESILVQRAIVDLLPQSPASRCYRIVASRLAGLGPAQGGLRLAPRGAVSGVSGSVATEEVPQCA
jgi:flagellar biosynthesis protein FlhG